MFEPIAELYKPVAVLGIIVADPKKFHQKVQDTWNVFKHADEDIIKDHLQSILRDYKPVGDPLFTEPVELEALYSTIAGGDDHEAKWENFAEEIKYKNRFFLNETIDLKLLGNLLNYFSKTYSKGKIFYRARISESIGFKINEMGKPPADKSTPGRANPKGIPYLYLATSVETAVYESRSSYLDFITIAEYKLREPLSIVSLRGMLNVSPFIFGDSIQNYIVHQKYLVRLERELSKPVRRFDKELDYLPSQYLCEYVKSLGYDAIEYGSSLKEGGINLAIFNDDKLQPIGIEVYEVSNVNLDFNKIVSV